MKSLLRPLVIVVALLVAVVAAGCGSSNDKTSSSSSSSTAASSSSTTAAAADPLGTPKKATGSPIVLGLLNIETGPVTFPEYRQAAEAAVKYINNYKGGIAGLPVVLASFAPMVSLRPPLVAHH